MVAIISRSEAIANKLPHYFTGQPCLRGHVSKRFTIGSTCCECRKAVELTDRWREANQRRSAAYYKKRKSTPEGAKKLRDSYRISAQKYHKRPDVKNRLKERRNSDHGRLKSRREKLKCLYGITVEQYDQMLGEQNFICAICSSPPPASGKLYIDHDHSTGKIRMLLCQRCNFAIGLMGDDSSLMENAAKYLIKFGR